MKVALIPVLVLLLGIPVGCGGESGPVVDSDEAEKLVERTLLEAAIRVGEVDSVECPTDQAVDPGATFECAVIFEDGDEETAVVRILTEKPELLMTELK